MRDVEDDFLMVQGEDSSAEVEINNPEVYQAFIKHLATLNSFQKPQEAALKKSKYQHVTRNIFEDELGDSDSNTHSNLTPRRQRSAASFSRLEQPNISVLPQLDLPYYP